MLAVLALMFLPGFDPAVLTLPVMDEPKITLHSALVKICTCESGQGTGKPQQYHIETGKVLRGEVNPKDIGMCQINEYWNGKKAMELEFDIYTEQGNIQMANYLYQTRGTQDWNWSRDCWGD